MKNAYIASLFLCLSAMAVAQSSAIPSRKHTQSFQHIVIIIQENRTPDNLFGASGLPGADVLINGRRAHPVPLSGGGVDYNHSHEGYLAEIGGKYPQTARNYVGSGAQEYWDLAAEYGFANRMFQTNQGGSYPAHQFLISGSSAPSDSSDLFVSDNAVPGSKYGCKSPVGTAVPTIAPDGSMGSVYPCFDRASLIDLAESAQLTWKYYVVSRPQLWNAPSSLNDYYESPNIVLDPPQVLTDIADGVLANISWVTPAKAYSDHPNTNTGGGPAWVASIVNAIGQSEYWDNTAIIVTWDDWGGWYDHVPPLANNTGWCRAYCYGFRVPMLVISAYTPAGYIDNDVHDFGSILRFVESNFTLGFIGQGGWADSFADNLDGFFSAGAARHFTPVATRPLTTEELEDGSEPDSD